MATASGPSPQVLQWLNRVLTPEYYQDPRRTFSDVAATLGALPSLAPRTSVFTYDDGQSELLLLLYGTVPVMFRGLVYNYPLSLWVPRSYPHQPPMAFVNPAKDMMIRPGNYVDTSGKVYHPYLQNWANTGGRSNIADLCDVLRSSFAREPPVVARQQPPPRPDSGSSPPPPPPPPPLPAELSARSPTTPQKPSEQERAPPALPPLPKELTRSRTLPTPADPSPPQRAPPPLPPHPPSQQPQQRSPQHYAPVYGSAELPQSTLPIRGPPPPAAPAHHAPAPPYFPQSPPAASPVYQPQHPHVAAQSVPPGRPENTGPSSIPPASPAHSQVHFNPARPMSFHAFPQQTYGGPPGSPRVPVTPASVPTPPKPKPVDLMDSPAPPLSPAATPQTAPPTPPPNPEKDRLIGAVVAQLHSRAETAVARTASSLDDIGAQREALLAAETHLERERAELSRITDVCDKDEAILRERIAMAQDVIWDAGKREAPDIDKVVVAPTVVHSQLYDLVTEDMAIEDTIYILGKALDRERIGLDVFLKHARTLAREQFLKRVLVRKISEQLGVS